MVKRKNTDTTNQLVDTIVEALQEKRGRNVVVVNLEGIPDTICQRFVLCTGGSPTQVNALAQNVGERAREVLGARPLTVSGMRNSLWVAMDYSDVIVHIFLPEERSFYDLEHLWADAELTEIADVD